MTIKESQSTRRAMGYTPNRDGYRPRDIAVYVCLFVDFFIANDLVARYVQSELAINNLPVGPTPGFLDITKNAFPRERLSLSCELTRLKPSSDKHYRPAVSAPTLFAFVEKRSRRIGKSSRLMANHRVLIRYLSRRDPRRGSLPNTATSPLATITRDNSQFISPSVLGVDEILRF